MKARDVGAGDSLPLGGLRLQAGSGGSLKAARDLVRDALDRSKVIRHLEGRTFYAIGGTWRSLARLHMHDSGYPLHVMHNYQMDPDELDDFLKVLIRGPLDQVPGISVVSKQRQALLPFGAVVLSEIFEPAEPNSVSISALGLREGLLFSKLSAKEQRADPLLSASSELNVLRSRSPVHGEELIPWTAAAMAVVGLEETEEEKRLRSAACLLADIGWRAHPDYRGEQSLNIITNAAFVGIDHPGRAYLALAIYYRHARSDGRGSWRRPQGARAAPLSRECPCARRRPAGRVSRVRRSRGRPPADENSPVGATAVELILPADLADLRGARLESRVRQFAALVGLPGTIVIDKK